MKNRFRLVAVGDTEQMTAYLHTLFANFCRSVGKDAASESFVDSVIGKVCALQRGSEAEIPYTRTMLMPDCGTPSEVQQFTVKRMPNGLFGATVEEVGEDFPFPQTELLALHREALQIPMFALYAGEHFDAPKGEVDFRDGDADGDFGDAVEAYLFFLLRGERRNNSEACRAIFEEIDRAAADKRDSAAEGLENLLSVFDDLKEIHFGHPDYVASLRKRDPDEFYEHILDAADTLLWDFAHAEALTRRLHELAGAEEDDSAYFDEAKSE